MEPSGIGGIRRREWESLEGNSTWSSEIVRMYRVECLFVPRRRGLLEITGEIAQAVGASGIREGMCNLFVRHTSAGLCIQENADPSVRTDLEEFLDRLVPFQDWFSHTAEGRDDMPSHIKTLLTGVSLNIPILRGRLALGTWQGIYLWEHRDRPPQRKVLLTIWE